MKFFCRAFQMELKQLLHNYKLLALLAAIPLCLGLLSLTVPQEELTPSAPVGWAMPDGCARGEELFSLLRQESGYVEFIQTDEETLRQNVASGKWECGFILRDDFDSQVEKLRYSRLFTLVKNQGSTMDPLVSEGVSAAMLALTARDIGADYLQRVGADVPAEGWILEEDLRLELIPSADGALGFSGVTANLGRNVFKGALAILLTLFSLSMGDAYARRREEAYYRRVAAVTGPVRCLLPALACQLLAMFAAALLCLRSARPEELAQLLALCLCLSALSFLLSGLPGGWSATVLPFLPVVMLVLCPILFDAAVFLPGLRWVSILFPATHYLNGALPPLLLWAGLYGLAGAVLLRTRLFYRE